MQPRKRTVSSRARPKMRMAYNMPFGNMRNPFKGGTKMASAGVRAKKSGVAVYFSVKF